LVRRHPQTSGRRASPLDSGPKTRRHLVEPLKFQIAKRLRLFDRPLTDRRKFRGDVSMCRVRIHAQL
jgi:hypothetical protein